MKYYNLIIGSGVDAEAKGPYETAAARDRDAREIVRLPDFNGDYDSIFRLDSENDVPVPYSFGSDELYCEETS